jgi:hypothetical protein
MRFVALALMVALAPASGCGGDDLAPVPLAEFSQRAEDAVCEWAVRCRHVPDDATCRRLIDPKDYDTRRAADAVAAERLGYDAGAAARCIDRTANASCLDSPFSDAACDGMLFGRVAEAGACTSNLECDSGADCESVVCAGQCCTGACGPAPFDPGEPPPRAEIGEACETHLDCVIDAYCETDRVCTAMPDEPGERCLFGCARGDLFCDIDSLTCIAYAARGAPCDAAGAAAPPCDPTWSYCDGVCVDRPGEGDPCDSADRRCIASTWCDGDPGACRARGSVGAACTDAFQCAVTCDGAVCLEYETCTIDE